MHKQLFIVRHGKSSADCGNISDIDRPLKERGVNDGYIMAERLLAKQLIPQKIMSSPAIRALHSSTIFARVFGYPYQNIEINETMYFADINKILSLINHTQNYIESLMVFGHNPTFTDLANFFINNQLDNIPTTGTVWLKFETNEWAKIDKKNIVGYFFDYPKNQI
ncbi:MAG: histidine phosphatase family protein [Bacteroidota bacterium]|nr:histidine phosphatase family protein [Bacteroidota bacterium]